jgi:hypothetical protein
MESTSTNCGNVAKVDRLKASAGKAGCQLVMQAPISWPHYSRL